MNGLWCFRFFRTPFTKGTVDCFTWHLKLQNNKLVVKMCLNGIYNC